MSGIDTRLQAYQWKPNVIQTTLQYSARKHTKIQYHELQYYSSQVY